MVVDPPKILLIGATGFIGGAILAHLIESRISTSAITCLVRGESRIFKLKDAYGDKVDPVLYTSNDDTEAITAIAAEHDIAINAGPGAHAPSALALVQGLAKRKLSTGKDVWLVHTSGTSNLADYPISGIFAESDPPFEFDDLKDDIYRFEKSRELKYLYAQRTAELAVVDTGLETGVKTLVIMSPLIYGTGSGLFNKSSIQIPGVARGFAEHGKGLIAGDGKATWDHVHVEDLADLYRIIVQEIIQSGGRGLPYGKKGIIFSADGRFEWLSVMQGVANTLYQQGKIASNKLEVTDLKAVTKVISPYFFGGDESVIEVGLHSNSRTVSSAARALGWKPTRRADWETAIGMDVKETLAIV